MCSETYSLKKLHFIITKRKVFGSSTIQDNLRVSEKMKFLWQMGSYSLFRHPNAHWPQDKVQEVGPGCYDAAHRGLMYIEAIKNKKCKIIHCILLCKTHPVLLLYTAIST